MKYVSALCVFLVACPFVIAEPAKTVPQQVLTGITDDDLNPLPKSMTEAERLLPSLRPGADELQRMAPPTGVVRTPAEYERNEGLLIRWGSYNSELTEMTVAVTTADPEAIMYILVSGSSQQNSATSTLTSAGADMSQVEFITYSSNSVWIRDYGPRYIFEDGVRAIVDHTYNRPRPLDNLFNDHLAALWGEPQYDIPLSHGGGNFHLFSTGDAFMSSLITQENPGQSEQDVKDLYLAYQNLDLTIYEGFPTSFDSTRHIDMWMFPVADDEIIIGEYSPTAGAPYTISEGAVTDLTARGYTVHRTQGWNSGGTHYTYTNAVVINSLVLVPRFGGSYVTRDTAAEAVFATAFPDRQTVPIYCGSIIHAAGAIHCIVMHVPAYDNPIPAARLLAPNGGEFWTIGQQYDITWTAADDVGVTSIDLYYSTDGGTTFPNVIALGETNDGVYPWTVPNTPSDMCQVKVVAHDADLNTGEDVSDADFVITPNGPQAIYSFPLDTDPGWTAQPQWAWGVPTGGGGEHGGPDPTSGHTGANVYGYNLAGDYANSIPELHLTSTVLDCSNLGGTELRFWRWLGVETPTYDHAYVRVSNDNTNWTTVWENTGEVADSSWVLQQFDISAVADGQSTVYLRWTMGLADSAYRYCGWNIDDIEIWGIPGDIDCNDNGIPDDEDIANCTGDPACADCNGNAVPDGCDITGGASQDCNGDAVPDDCQLAGNDCNANDVPDECEGDCNTNGTPDDCDIANCTGDPACDDCNGNSVPDGCDINGGGSTDGNTNGIPDECETVEPLAEDSFATTCSVDGDCPPGGKCVSGVCYLPKNRYISIDPNPENAARQTARRVLMDAGGRVLVVAGWLGAPQEVTVAGPEATPQLLARIVDFDSRHYRDWSVDDLGQPWTDSTVHLGDCEISPGHTYIIHAITEGLDPAFEGNFSEPLELATTAQFGDVVGASPGTAPDGTRNFKDISSVVRGFQGTQSEPKVCLDLQGPASLPEVPDFSDINFKDIDAAVAGFQGAGYPLAQPCDCPGQSCP